MKKPPKLRASARHASYPRCRRSGHWKLCDQAGDRRVDRRLQVFEGRLRDPPDRDAFPDQLLGRHAPVVHGEPDLGSGPGRREAGLVG